MSVNDNNLSGLVNTLRVLLALDELIQAISGQLSANEPVEWALSGEKRDRIPVKSVDGRFLERDLKECITSI